MLGNQVFLFFRLYDHRKHLSYVCIYRYIDSHLFVFSCCAQYLKVSLQNTSTIMTITYMRWLCPLSLSLSPLETFISDPFSHYSASGGAKKHTRWWVVQERGKTWNQSSKWWGWGKGTQGCVCGGGGMGGLGITHRCIASAPHSHPELQKCMTGFIQMLSPRCKCLYHGWHMLSHKSVSQVA